jgi:hypothetical protein
MRPVVVDFGLVAGGGRASRCFEEVTIDHKKNRSHQRHQTPPIRIRRLHTLSLFQTTNLHILQWISFAEIAPNAGNGR